MIILKIKNSFNLKEQKFSKNLKQLKKNTYNFVTKKENKYISVLRSPHVFSKFKQRFGSASFLEIFKFKNDFLNIILLHKFIEEDFIYSLTIIKKYK